MHFLDILLQDVKKNVEAYTVDAYIALVETLAPTLVALVGLYIVVQGIRLYLGYGDHSVTSYIRQTFILTMIMILATSWGWFSALVVDTVTKGPDVLITALIGRNGSTDGTTGFFTQFYDASFEVFIKIFKEGGWTNIAPLFIGVIGMGAAIILVAVVFMLLVSAEVLLSVLLVLAPLIIPLYLFLSTRYVCMSWIKMLVSVMFVPLLVYAISGLFMNVLENQLGQLSTQEVDVYKVLAYLITVLICLLLMKQVPTLAISLGGEAIYERNGFNFLSRSKQKQENNVSSGKNSEQNQQKQH